MNTGNSLMENVSLTVLFPHNVSVIIKIESNPHSPTTLRSAPSHMAKHVIADAFGCRGDALDVIFTDSGAAHKSTQ